MIQLLDRLRSRTFAFTHDLGMVPLAWLGAYWLRFNLGQIPDPYWDACIMALPVLVPVQGAAFWAFGLYRGVWRFASVPDLERILKAVATGTILSLGVLFAWTRLADVPRSVPVLFALLQLTLLAGPRLLYRWVRDRRLDLSKGPRVLIVGAGRAGEMLVRDMLRDPERPYVPVAFVDDLPRRQGSDIQGIPVVGDCGSIPQLVAEQAIDLIVLAIPSASSRQMRRLVDLCEQTGVAFHTLPKLNKLITGQVSLHQVRAVSIEDLLGREPVTLDWDAIGRGVSGRVILVTGGGGSIGSELCRQIARQGPSRLVILDNCEFNLYSIEMELRQAFPLLDLVIRLGDVTDAAGLRRLFTEQRPQVVYHAAAYKHVPMLEGQAREAVRVNVLGTRQVADAAGELGCGEFVLISTDKAVNPTNVMGASKRLAELYCQTLGDTHGTRYITVRFGNVLDSAGSVVPLFRRQIQAGGPVTVTDPDVERYFMTIPEACQLIMQAGVMGRGGEIFVLDMGEPIKIRYLAEQMIRLSGSDPAKVAIQYIGLRPGEKLYEELFYASEDLAPTPHERIRVAQHLRADRERIRAGLEQLALLVVENQGAALGRCLQELVPEWRGEPPGAGPAA